MVKTKLEWAEEIWTERSNGSCEGMSSSKGGRVWLNGEFRLLELEALCIIIRERVGEDVEGFEEHKQYWENEE